MAFFELTRPDKGFGYSFDTEKALAAPIGAASPLWLAFAGATGAGLAWWWMSRWMQPVNLEAFLIKAPSTGLALVAPPEPAAEAPVVEAVAAEAVELAAEPEPAAEVPVEAAPVVEATAVEPESPAAEPVVRQRAPKAAAPKAPPKSED